MRDRTEPTENARDENTWPIAFSAEVVRPVFGRVSGYTIALEAWRRGLTVTAMNAGIHRFRVSNAAGKTIKFSGARPEMTTSRAIGIAQNKHRTNKLLRTAGLSVPESRPLDADNTTEEDLLNTATSIGYPVVLKPISGTKGKGVFTNIRDNRELLHYFEYLVTELRAKHIVMESHVSGELDVRVLVIDETVAGAINRIPANVTGDGRHTIDELIDQKNAIRAKNPFLHSGPIVRDNEVLNYIDEAGHTLETVLIEGEQLRLRGKSNGSAGGDSIDITNELPQEVKDDSVRAVKAIPGLYCAGVDILCSVNSDGFSYNYDFIEINATPQIGLNMYPIIGTGQDVPRIWVDTCFPDSSRSETVGEHSLTFSLDEVGPALQSGAASEITIPRIPASRLPHRRIYDFDPKASLSHDLKRRLTLKARKLGISGSLEPGEAGYTLAIAAETERDADTFARRVAKELRSPELPRFTKWEGIVRLGFRIIDGH